MEYVMSLQNCGSAYRGNHDSNKLITHAGITSIKGKTKDTAQRCAKYRVQVSIGLYRSSIASSGVLEG